MVTASVTGSFKAGVPLVVFISMRASEPEGSTSSYMFGATSNYHSDAGLIGVGCRYYDPESRWYSSGS